MGKIRPKFLNDFSRANCDRVSSALRDIGIESTSVWTGLQYVVRFKVSGRRNIYAEFFSVGWVSRFDSINLYEGYGRDLRLDAGLIGKVGCRLGKLVSKLYSMGCHTFANSLTIYVDGREAGNAVNPLQWMLF